MFHGPTSGVQLSYGITQGTYYTHDSKWLPYGLPIATHLWAKMAENGW
jgi:hypothetical protein